MKGDTQVIGYLNKVLFNELTAINQYYLHAKMLKNWGFAELAERDKKQSIVDMIHADELAERILFLEGLPNFQSMGKLMIGENPKEILACDLALKQNQGVTTLREAISVAETQGDYVSRQLFARILKAEEDHIDWIETQLNLISEMSLEVYLQSQIED